MPQCDRMKIVRVIGPLNVGGPAIRAIPMTRFFPDRGCRRLLLTGEAPRGRARTTPIPEDGHRMVAAYD
jgi:hypothetical protein